MLLLHKYIMFLLKCEEMPSSIINIEIYIYGVDSMHTKVATILSEEITPLIPNELLEEYNDFVNPELREVLRANCLRRYLEGAINLLLKNKIVQVADISAETWDEYSLNNKIQAIGKHYDCKIKDDFDKLRKIGNKGSHFGDTVLSEEVLEGIEIATHIIEKILIKYFKDNPIGSQMEVLTLLSSLPPNNRVYILEEIFNDGQKNTLVIDKLSMAYLKSGDYEKSISFLEEQKNAEIISEKDYRAFVGKIDLLNQNLDKFDFAKDVLDVKKTFYEIVNSHDYNEFKEFTDLFLILISGYGIKN